MARMAYVDLSQDAAAMRHIFLSLGLAAPAEDVHATPLPGGVSSALFRVELRSGTYCVKQALPQLKVAKEWKVPVERVFFEIAYLKRVDTIVPGRVPRVLGQDDATHSFVMEFLGPEYSNWKAELLAGRVSTDIAQQVGSILGRIHAATADNPEVAKRFATDDNFNAIRLEPYLLEAAQAHPVVADRLTRIVERTARTRRVLVHGDISPENVMVGPYGPVLLDAECAWFGEPAFDVAFCLNHFLLKAAHMPAQARPLLDCLRLFADAYASYVAWEPPEALERRIALLLPALALARIDGKSPVAYLEPSQRDAVRRVSLALLQEAPTSLSEITQRWRAEFAQ
jgi:aminoglycoside phosphotransferase (APT) family kinase protein